MQGGPLVCTVAVGSGESPSRLVAVRWQSTAKFAGSKLPSGSCDVAVAVAVCVAVAVKAVGVAVAVALSAVAVAVTVDVRGGVAVAELFGVAWRCVLVAGARQRCALWGVAVAVVTVRGAVESQSESPSR